MVGRRSVGEASSTRHAVVKRTAELASAEGLDGVSVGAIASALGMSKAGVVGQFGSKLALQVEAIQFARETFVERVWAPVRHQPPGIRRLVAVCERWAHYAGHPPFPGGCLLVAASVEFDDKAGPVHDTVADALRAWRTVLEYDIRMARDAGDLPSTTDPTQQAYVLEALAAWTQTAMRIHDGEGATRLCRRAMLTSLGR